MPVLSGNLVAGHRLHGNRDAVQENAATPGTPDCCRMRAVVMPSSRSRMCIRHTDVSASSGDCHPDTSPAGPCSCRPTDAAERRLTACRRPHRCADSGRRLTMPSLACFEVELPLRRSHRRPSRMARRSPSVGCWYASVSVPTCCQWYQSNATPQAVLL